MRAHAFRDKPLEIGRHRSIVFTHDEPTRLRFPRRRSHGGVEQIRRGWIVRCPHDLLLGFRKIATEVCYPRGFHPDAAVGHFDLLKDRSRRKLTELLLRGLALVGAERADVDEPANAVVGARPGYDLAAVGMSDQ